MTLCKQHEAEKKYLEEEINRKGKRKPNSHHPKTDTAGNITRTCSNPDQTPNQQATSINTEPGPSLVLEPKQTALKEVNILEDLEKKFGSMYGRGRLLDYHAVNKKPGARVSSSRTIEKGVRCCCCCLPVGVVMPPRSLQNLVLYSPEYTYVGLNLKH